MSWRSGRRVFDRFGRGRQPVPVLALTATATAEVTGDIVVVGAGAVEDPAADEHPITRHSAVGEPEHPLVVDTWLPFRDHESAQLCGDPR